MPGKRFSKAYNHVHAFLGENSKNIKKLSTNDAKLQQQRLELASQEKEIHALEMRLKRKRDKIKEIEEVLVNSGSTDQSTSVISQKCKKRRLSKPSSIDLNLKAKSIRRAQTYSMCQAIHGGSEENKEPTLWGMVDTLTAKFKADKLSLKLLNSKTALKHSLTERTLKQHTKQFINSEENMVRSLSVYYAHNVMGKRKYNNVRSANRSRNVSNFVSYKNLAKRISNIDIGNVQDIEPTLTTDVPPEEIGRGCYRDTVEFCQRLAQFYLQVNESRVDKLQSFLTLERKSPNSFLFLIAIGGDEAPGSGTSFLLSFLNVGYRIASSQENYIIFGANVKENSLVVRNYVKKLVKDLKYLEDNIFSVDVRNKLVTVEFKVESVPNDMKMLAFLSGELSNSSFYFTTFANVNQDDSKHFSKKFSMEKNSDADWKPFSYDKRIIDARKVAHKKKELDKKKIKPQTYRNHVTSFIRSLGSRQEEVPLLEKYIDKAKCEPLHLKNNTVKELFMKIMSIVLGVAKISQAVKRFEQLPETNIFCCFVQHITKDMNCNALGKKLREWFNESSDFKTEKGFQYRFRGKESSNYLKFFPGLIATLIILNDSIEFQKGLIQVFYKSIMLRKLVSYSVRIDNVSEVEINEMEIIGHSLFKCCCLYDLRVSPSMWVFCHVAPKHAKLSFNTLNLGLGINTMEGREQKHQMIAKYARNTTFQDRWKSIFRHEFIQLIHLREHGFDKKKYFKQNHSYLPKISEKNCSSCSYTLDEQNNCVLCSNPLLESLIKEIGYAF